MRTLIAIAAAAIVAAAGASPAAAREGCGNGFHRAMNGMCRANKGTQARWLEGHYYAGRGYYYQNGWYPRRHRHNGTWIYVR